MDAADKRELVADYTHGRETSSAKMTVGEMDALIKHLEGERQASLKKMRAKIINIAKDIFNVREMSQANWDALNVFLKAKFHARLDELPYEPLRNAVTAIEKWRDYETKKMTDALLHRGGEPTRSL